MSGLLGDRPWIGLRGAIAPKKPGMEDLEFLFHSSDDYFKYMLPISGITSIGVYLFTYKKLTQDDNNRGLPQNNSEKHLFALLTGTLTILCFIAPGLVMKDSEENLPPMRFDRRSENDVED